MAVFMLNVCKFKDCGLSFKSLGHLIQHIEETHIDFDPHVVEKTEQQQPTCIPMSYVLRFLTDATRKENTRLTQQTRCHQTSFSSLASLKTNASTGSEAEEGEDFVSEPDDSNDSWAASEEFSPDFNLRYKCNRTVNHNTLERNNILDKPFACSVPGCKKRYKNVNGIKYHSKNGHKNDGKTRKAFECACGKSYKTSYGLKNHNAMQHSGSLLQIKLPSKAQPKTENDCDNSLYNSIEESFESSPKTPIKVARTKIVAIEDHGYMKQDPRLDYMETDCENNLGILTPAASPPLSAQSPLKAGAAQIQSLHNYFIVNPNQSHRD